MYRIAEEAFTGILQQEAKEDFCRQLAELLSGEQQDALLQAMESGSAEFSQLPAKVFFSFLLQNTREGFFSDPIHPLSWANTLPCCFLL